MEEEDQRAQILDRMNALALDPMALWLHFLSLGGNANHLEVMEYLEGNGMLPNWDRALLIAAARELTM